MRRLVFILVYVFITYAGYSQVVHIKNTRSREADDVYYQVVNRLTKDLSTFNLNHQYDSIYVNDLSILNRQLPAKMNGIRIIYVDDSLMKKMTKQGRTFSMYDVKNLQFGNGLFYVEVIQFDVTRKNGIYHRVNKQGPKYSFSYNCENNCLMSVYD